MDDEYDELIETELAPAGETKEARAERLFAQRHGLSSGEAFSILKLTRPDVTAATQALIETKGLQKRINLGRVDDYMMASIGRLAKRLMSQPGDIQTHVQNPSANFLAIIEMDLSVSGLCYDAIKWELVPPRDGDRNSLEAYKAKLAGSERARREDEIDKTALIPVFKKPLADLTADDFLRLYYNSNLNRKGFTYDVTMVAVFQAAQTSLAPAAIMQPRASATDRAEALALINRLHDALDKPHVLQAIIADPAASTQMAEVFERLGLGRADQAKKLQKQPD